MAVRDYVCRSHTIIKHIISYTLAMEIEQIYDEKLYKNRGHCARDQQSIPSFIKDFLS